ncbi:MAG: sigma-70 family RNA polymerase sigma factor [Limisphaerales bacterium]
MKTNLLADSCHCASAPSLAAETRTGLLVAQAEIRDQVSRLVRRISRDPYLYQDLLQEALLCLWRAEVRKPGQTVSWYQQRCRFRIRDYLRAGRSVDSLKHHRSARSIDELEDSGGGPRAPEGDLLQEVCARDLFDELMRQLDPAGQRTLRLLREERTVREIARELHLSHVAVLGQRRRIAAAAVGLGIER